MRQSTLSTASMTSLMDTNARAEKWLGLLYGASTVATVVSITSFVVVWQHWAWTLDVCINVDCGCILYGIKTFSTFMGGDVKLCHFGTFGLVPVMLVALVLGLFHGYRACIPRTLSVPRVAVIEGSSFHKSRTSLDGRVMVVRPKQRAPCKQWMPAAFAAILISCLSLAHAVVLSDGYLKTCEQYRRNLTRLLGSTGQESQVIYNRLGCGAVLDFMDYIQPDANNWRRADAINTGLALQLAIVMSWLNFACWFAIFVVNITMERVRLKSEGEKFCCCL